MRTEHVKRNIDTNKAVRKTSLANCFFYVRLFPLVELLLRFVNKKRISIKKEMPLNEAPPFGFVVCLSPLKTGILFQKILLLACDRLQDKAQAIGL